VLDEEDLDLVTQLDGINGAGAAGEERFLAILFADIRGYTSFSEKLPPYDVIYSLNRYYHHVGKIITRNKGYIDNYMGDGFMALFGLEGDEDSVFNAVRSGLEVLEAVKRLSPYFELLYGCSFKVGIGVHYGQVVVGSIGFQKKRTSVIGDSVNFASRIEEANKQAGTSFLISQDAYRQIKDRVKTKACQPIGVPGKTGLHSLYEVLEIPNP
jgi:adenylate cyclase